MKNLLKYLIPVAIIGGVAVAMSGGETVVAEGNYNNKGQTAKWKIAEKDDVLIAYIKFPENKWTEIAQQGTLESLGQVIDQRMRENGYLPEGQMNQDSSSQRAGLN